MLKLLNSRQRTKWSILAAALLALVVAMILDTKFLSATADAEGRPAAFDPTTFAQDKWPGLVDQISSEAVDVTELATVADSDPAAAGEKYGQDLGAGSYAFAVKATGTVAKVDANFITLSVPGMPAEDVVRIPLGMALNGSAVRDATGTIHYGDFTDQTAYQDVANALKALIQQNVLAELDPASLNGTTLTVTGAAMSGGPPRAYLIQPVTIEAEQ